MTERFFLLQFVYCAAYHWVLAGLDLVLLLRCTHQNGLLVYLDRRRECAEDKVILARLMTLGRQILRC